MKTNEPPKKLRSKKADSTTLKTCGWCKYASGTHRHSYCIEGKCHLDKSYSKDITWNTDCKFKDASKKDIQAIIKSHKYTIKESKHTIERHRDYIADLATLLLSAPERPTLPEDRKSEHFNIDDLMAIWYSEKGKWYFGEVKNGYRHQDGCVSFRIDAPNSPQKANDTKFPYKEGYWGCGMCVPTVMLKKEYDYFLQNPKDYKIWCVKAYDKSFNGQNIKIAPITL